MPYYFIDFLALQYLTFILDIPFGFLLEIKTILTIGIVLLIDYFIHSSNILLFMNYNFYYFFIAFIPALRDVDMSVFSPSVASSSGCSSFTINRWAKIFFYLKGKAVNRT